MDNKNSQEMSLLQLVSTLHKRIKLYINQTHCIRHYHSCCLKSPLSTKDEWLLVALLQMLSLWTSFDSFALRNTVFVSCIHLTSLVPVQMGDVIHWAFAHTNPLAAHHVVNIHKAVTWCHRQILACYCDKNQFFSFEPYHDPAITFLVIC